MSEAQRPKETGHAGLRILAKIIAREAIQARLADIANRPPNGWSPREHVLEADDAATQAAQG